MALVQGPSNKVCGDGLPKNEYCPNLLFLMSFHNCMTVFLSSVKQNKMIVVGIQCY